MKLVFTVCSVSYLGQAKTMADSLCRYNPDYQVIIGLLDKIPSTFDLTFFRDYTLIEIEKINIPKFDELIQRYDILEMSGISRVFLIKYLFEQYPSLQKIIYVDTDILFFDSLDNILQKLDDKDILLTPHILSPFKDDHYPRELGFLNGGLYNAGFFAIKRSKNTFNFLDWWQERVCQYGYVRFMDGMFAEQIWLNFVPLFFKNVEILDDMGVNCAYWNLHERRFTQDKQGKYWVNERFPLIFFHFSGYKPTIPEKISVHFDRYDFVDRPELKPIFNLYHQQLLANKDAEFSKIPNALIPRPKYLKWGKLRDYSLRIARKIIRELHG